MEKAEKANDMDLTLGNRCAFEGCWSWDEFPFTAEAALGDQGVYFFKFFLVFSGKSLAAMDSFSVLRRWGTL